MHNNNYQESVDKQSNNAELLLSIVVPVYNVEKYLDKCLQSIADQTLDPAKFEVIMVDDKSTDNSLKICKRFCKRYKNFKIIELPYNTPGGAGIPSNIGISNARGKYLGFVDSDDYIEVDMFEKLLIKGLETDSDLVICGFKLFYQKENKFKNSYDMKSWRFFCNAYNENASFVEIQKRALLISPVPWRKLYKLDFLKRNNIKYPEGDFFYEDNVLHWISIVKSNSIAIFDVPLVVHRMGRDGQTMSLDPKRLLVFSTHADTIKNFLNSTYNYEKFKYEYISWVFNKTLWISPIIKKFVLFYSNKISILFKDIGFKEILTCKNIYAYKFSTFCYCFLIVKGYPTFGIIVKTIDKTLKKIGKLIKAFKHFV